VAGRREVVAFRNNGGRLASVRGSSVLLLSRLTQISPLTYLTAESDPDVVYVMASGAGADPRHRMGPQRALAS
jgi:hypothetical protein